MYCYLPVFLSLFESFRRDASEAKAVYIVVYIVYIAEYYIVYIAEYYLSHRRPPRRDIDLLTIALRL